MRPLGLIRNHQRTEDIIAGFPVLILVALALFLLKTAIIDHVPQTIPIDGSLFAQIDGDVRHPGIYSFNGRATVRDLILRAGNSYPDKYDITAPIRSGTRITIQVGNDGNLTFTEGEISAFHKITLGIPISINTESEEGLTAVPGIGPGLAGLLIRERNKRGGFTSIEELKSVYGIGEKTYAKIKTYVTL
jgi:competence protein ComEA